MVTFATDTSEGAALRDEMLAHKDHTIEMATYRRNPGEEPWNVAIECMECHSVIVDVDIVGEELTEVYSEQLDKITRSGA